MYEICAAISNPPRNIHVNFSSQNIVIQVCGRHFMKEYSIICSIERGDYWSPQPHEVEQQTNYLEDIFPKISACSLSYPCTVSEFKNVLIRGSTWLKNSLFPIEMQPQKSPNLAFGIKNPQEEHAVNVIDHAASSAPSGGACLWLPTFQYFLRKLTWNS